jgi:hypothetical protein
VRDDVLRERLQAAGHRACCRDSLERCSRRLVGLDGGDDLVKVHVVDSHDAKTCLTIVRCQAKVDDICGCG